MRIIAGTARGRIILSVPKKTPVRPISSRIRQSLFDIIRPKVPASMFLDLFAGTGAVGIEALSRGAAKVIFVEKDRMCIKVIEKNLDRLGFQDRACVLKGDVLSGVEWLEHYCRLEGDQGYDLIFMGPPYKGIDKRRLAFTSRVLELVSVSGILARSGWVAAQHHVKEQVENPGGLEFFRRSRYGDTFISFFKRRTLGHSPVGSVSLH